VRLTHQYRIKPSPEQEALMLHWLELLRQHWNYALGQRLDYLRRTRSPIDRCSLRSCPIGEIPERPNYYTQARDLKQTKALFPEYKDIYLEVQQQNLIRLDKAWDRWTKPDATGKRAGRPQFKKTDELRSFTFPRVNCPKAGVHLLGEVIKFSKIGVMPVILHRPIPEGFVIKTATVVHKVDGWFVSLSLEDTSIPAPMPCEEVKTAVGVDVGLKEFLTTSEGDAVAIQHIYRKAQKRLARQQRKLARQQKGSKNAVKQKKRVALVHQRIQRQRENFHYNTAHDLCSKYDLIAVEDLNIKGLARTRLAKSILDAAWGAFLQKLEAVAVKRGKLVIKVNPWGTSQDCSGCGTKVPKTLSIRTHECPKCGLELDRDVNAARNILERALCTVGLTVSACGGLGVAQPMKQEVSLVIGRSPRQTR